MNAAGCTPLAIACALGRTDLVRFLLERRAAVEADGAVPALIAAAASPDDNADVVKLLLKRGARVDATDNHGRASLAIAAQHDNAPASSTSSTSRLCPGSKRTAVPAGIFRRMPRALARSKARASLVSKKW